MTLYLGIPEQSGIDYGWFPWYGIVHRLERWLGTCCGGSHPVRIITTNRRHQMTPFDGLVYLVGYWENSLIAKMNLPQSESVRGGCTAVVPGKDGGMLSEVYVSAREPMPVAATIYHELLHNKFQLYFKDIHSTPGGNFTNAMAPFSGEDPSPADQALMCEALGQSSRQYQGFLE